MNALSFYNNLINRISLRETDPINRARVKMLIFGLTSNLVFTTLATCVYLIQGPYLQAARAVISLFFAGLLLFAVYKWKVWRLVGHVLIWLMSLVVWTNLLLFVQGANIPTLQFVFLIVVFSFYIHGLRWGLVYSFMNILPTIAYVMLDGKNYFNLSVPPQAVSQPAFVFVITYNFLLIVFLHFHFFRTFNRNIIRVTSSKNEFKSLNEKLREAMDELERSSDARMNFLSTMSHELRTPLNGVIGMSNVLLMQNPRKDQEENLSVLKFSAENLLSLINDILDLNKLESKKVELESIPFDLSRLLKNTFAGLKLRAQEKGLDFQLSVSEEIGQRRVKSDPTRLTQVLLNLLNNALKFTIRGSVSFDVKTLKMDEQIMKVRFRVKDTGIGIAEDKLQHIFEPFTQASKSTTRNFGGTGLGLAIVKRILEMFNSEIKISSMPGKGTIFYFDIDFPHEALPVDLSSNIVEKRKDLSGLKVLVAEDNPVNVMVIKKILSNWNIEPVVAENGLIALKKIQERDFDVVLMDLHMPELDGYQASMQIRMLSNPDKARVPIIALTASASNSVNNKVISSGMNGYLSKPFNPDDLYDKLFQITDLSNCT